MLNGAGNSKKWEAFNNQLVTVGRLKRYFVNFKPKLDCDEQLTVKILQPEEKSYLITGDFSSFDFMLVLCNFAITVTIANT